MEEGYDDDDAHADHAYGGAGGELAELDGSGAGMDGSSSPGAGEGSSAGPAASPGASAEYGPNDIAKILIATDCHVGYMEKDPIRGMDSFNAFEEVLQTARDKDVDLVLLAGDLFHENKPSRMTMFKTMQILRRYVMGYRPIRVQVVGDQAVHFGTRQMGGECLFNRVNWEDPHYNVDLPIFTIHGNHDDPVREAAGSSEELLAALDLLAVSNLVNYFGRSETADRVDLYPLLLAKGRTRLALYGLGAMRDDRFQRLLVTNAVHFHRPPPEHADDFFSIFMIHQNRDNRGVGVRGRTGNTSAESLLPGFLDLVIWGHEHECLTHPRKTSEAKSTFVLQPGSTVATALSDGESARKHTFLLEVRGSQFRCTPLPLRCVRPFKIRHVALLGAGAGGPASVLAGGSSSSNRAGAGAGAGAGASSSAALGLLGPDGITRAGIDPHSADAGARVSRFLEDVARSMIAEVEREIAAAAAAAERVAAASGDGAGAGAGAGAAGGRGRGARGGAGAAEEASPEDVTLAAQLPPPDMRKPLIRIKVEHTGFNTLSNQRFGSLFASAVANPNDMLLFWQKRRMASAADAAKDRPLLLKDSVDLDDDGDDGAIMPLALGRRGTGPEGTVRVEDLVGANLRTASLQLLSTDDLTAGLAKFVSGDPNAIKDVIELAVKAAKRAAAEAAASTGPLQSSDDFNSALADRRAADAQRRQEERATAAAGGSTSAGAGAGAGAGSSSSSGGGGTDGDGVHGSGSGTSRLERQAARAAGSSAALHAAGAGAADAAAAQRRALTRVGRGGVEYEDEEARRAAEEAEEREMLLEEVQRGAVAAIGGSGASAGARKSRATAAGAGAGAGAGSRSTGRMSARAAASAAAKGKGSSRAGAGKASARRRADDSGDDDDDDDDDGSDGGNDDDDDDDDDDGDYDGRVGGSDRGNGDDDDDDDASDDGRGRGRGKSTAGASSRKSAGAGAAAAAPSSSRTATGALVARGGASSRGRGGRAGAVLGPSVARSVKAAAAGPAHVVLDDDDEHDDDDDDEISIMDGPATGGAGGAAAAPAQRAPAPAPAVGAKRPAAGTLKAFATSGSAAGAGAPAASKPPPAKRPAPAPAAVPATPSAGSGVAPAGAQSATGARRLPFAIVKK